MAILEIVLENFRAFNTFFNKFFRFLAPPQDNKIDQISFLKPFLAN